MKTKFVAFSALALASFALAARGQSPGPSVVTASPAPVVTPMAPPAPAGAPNQVVFAPRLPTAEELSNAAAAQGLTIDRIEQTSAKVTVVFRSTNGQINTVAYKLVPPAVAPYTAQAPPSDPPSNVVYERAPRVVYYNDYPSYWPYYWRPPFSLHFGVGYGHRHGGHHRHYRR